MAGQEMRTDRRRIIKAVIVFAVIAGFAILVPVIGNASYGIGYWLGSH